ncbi:MAG: GNAT family N-acetyltransferase [Cyclobacteriaceae bacterium]|nr:GNAT family N-acetyltransferase [Cyclobacteriaceae bacterium]
MMIENDKESERSNFQMLEGIIPVGFKIDFDESLFNSKAHRKLQSSSGWHSFHLLRKDKRFVVASIHFCLEKFIALSPAHAPFGSFGISVTVTPSQLFEFIRFIEEKLIKHGTKKIIIKCPPEQFNVSQHNILTVLLFNHQYQISNAELGACLQISKAPFFDLLDSWEKRKLNQGIKANLKFKIIPMDQLNEIYNFILTCREERNQSLSMTYKELYNTVRKSEDYFILFGVYHDGDLVAASIAIRVKKNILYNFYSAHSKSSDSLSPVVFLIDKIYGWCSKHHTEILDLGTSAWDGKPNFPLIDFKLRLGAIPSMKLTFEKTIV